MFLDADTTHVGMTTVVARALKFGEYTVTGIAFLSTAVTLFAWLRVALGGDATAMGSALVFTVLTLLLWSVVIGIESLQNRGD